jgi:hypothetical protein
MAIDDFPTSLLPAAPKSDLRCQPQPKRVFRELTKSEIDDFGRALKLTGAEGLPVCVSTRGFDARQPHHRIASLKHRNLEMSSRVQDQPLYKQLAAPSGQSRNAVDSVNKKRGCRAQLSGAR